MSLMIDINLQRGNFSLSLQTQLPAQGVTAIYGRSGAGKTTLLRWLAGLEKNTEGRLHFNNQCWQDEKTFLPTQQRQIGYVFQDARLFPHLSVHGNLVYASERRFNNHGPSIQQVCQWFELEPLLTKHAPYLSGGQQQRVAMARSLLSSPQLVLMDEPLASLDSQSKDVILGHLEQLHNHVEAPIIYISHDMDEVSRLANHLLLLEEGRIAAQGPLLELSTRLDLRLSHEENAASIIEATVQQHDQQYHLTELTIGSSTSPTEKLFLTKNGSHPGDKVRIRVPARDVSIALQKPKDSSILNSLLCTIDAIEKTSDARVMVRLKLADQYLLARLTHKSVDLLGLHVGQPVYAQIKTVALLNER